MEGKEVWVLVKNLSKTNSKRFMIRSSLVYHYIDENHHEAFDPSKFKKGNNYCVYYGGSAVRHAAFDFADTKEELAAKMNIMKGNKILRGPTVAPRRSLTPVVGPNRNAQANFVMSDLKRKQKEQQPKKMKKKKTSTVESSFNEAISTEDNNVVSESLNIEKVVPSDTGVPSLDEKSSPCVFLDEEGLDDSDEDDKELTVGSGERQKSLSTSSPNSNGLKDEGNSTVVSTNNDAVVQVNSSQTQQQQNVVGSALSLQDSSPPAEDVAATMLKRISKVEKDVQDIKNMSSQILDVVNRIHKATKKCRISQLSRAVEGYEDEDVPDDYVLVGHVGDTLKFISKANLVKVEKDQTQLKGRILELGKLFYGDEFYKYSLTGVKEGKSVTFKIESEHLHGLSTILKCFHWSKPEDTSVERIGRVVCKYFSGARKDIEKKEHTKLLEEFEKKRMGTPGQANE